MNKERRLERLALQNKRIDTTVTAFQVMIFIQIFLSTIRLYNQGYSHLEIIILLTLIGNSLYILYSHYELKKIDEKLKEFYEKYA